MSTIHESQNSRQSLPLPSDDDDDDGDDDDSDDCFEDREDNDHDGYEVEQGIRGQILLNK